MRSNFKLKIIRKRMKLIAKFTWQTFLATDRWRNWLQ